MYIAFELPILKCFRLGFVGGLALLASACSTLEAGMDDTESMWKPGSIHAEAQASSLEAQVERVAGEYRELRDRFDALERLYIDLARNARTQGERLQTAVNNYEAVARDPEMVRAIEQAEASLITIQETVQKLEDRVFKVEMAGGAITPNFANRTPQLNTSRLPVQDSTSSAANAVPVDATPLEAIREPAASLYAIHLTSLRTADQARNTWQSLRQLYGSEVADLTPLLYRQTRAGLTILRLLAGPYTSAENAEAACEALRAIDEGQFCAVTDYQGDPLP